jgi:hypothetical protein
MTEFWLDEMEIGMTEGWDMIKRVTCERDSRVCLSRGKEERGDCGSNLHRAPVDIERKATLDRRRGSSERLVSSVDHFDDVEVIGIVEVSIPRCSTSKEDNVRPSTTSKWSG